MLWRIRQQQVQMQCKSKAEAAHTWRTHKGSATHLGYTTTNTMIRKRWWLPLGPPSLRTSNICRTEVIAKRNKMKEEVIGRTRDARCGEGHDDERKEKMIRNETNQTMKINGNASTIVTITWNQCRQHWWWVELRNWCRWNIIENHVHEAKGTPTMIPPLSP